MLEEERAIDNGCISYQLPVKMQNKQFILN